MCTHMGNVAKLRSVVVVSIIASWLHMRIKSQQSFRLLFSQFFSPWFLFCCCFCRVFFSSFFCFIPFFCFVLFFGNVECMRLCVSLKSCCDVDM